MSWNKLVNTRYFSEAAIDFVRNGGRYTLAPPGSREYREYWELHEERCRNGYKVGDTWITGRHYDFLNFTPILKISDAKLSAFLKDMVNNRGKIGMRTMEKVLEFPRFYEVGYQWYRYKHIAWNGGRFRNVISPGGKHLVCAKARGAGFSYMEAEDGVYNYKFLPGSKSYYFAATEQFLTTDGILNKVKDMLDWTNIHIPWWYANRMEHDTLMHMKSSYIDAFGAKRGNMSEIIGTIVDNPNKVRGKRGRKIVFEEAGSFKNLKRAVAISKKTIEDGGFMTGQMSIFGCVCAGTMVYKANGERTLVENLRQEDGILGYNGDGISQEPITWMKAPATKPCVEIMLETGIKLRCSIDHPILTTNNQLKEKKGRLQSRRVIFKPAEEVRLGDMITVVEEVPIFGEVKNPYAYTTGYLVGDGYYCSSIEVIIDNDLSLSRISEETKLMIKRKHKTGSGGYADSYTVGGSIRQYLKGNGMFGQSKMTKRLPKDWDSYDQESLAALLAGYFDADGNCKKDKVRGVAIIYTSVVPELLEQVQRAMMKFGIHGTITQEYSKGGYTDGHTVYRLYITRAESVERFRKMIPILNPTKSVPKQTKRVNKLLRDAKLIRDSSHKLSGRLLNGAILYRVTSVKDIGEQVIYNLTAGKTHTYLANNIITHNTGGEEGPSIEGLEEIFDQPDVYNCLAFPNEWDEDQEGNTCGFFVPITIVDPMFMDGEGNPDMEAATKYQLDERALKEKAKDPKELDMLKAEQPMKPSEVFQRLTRNPFRKAEIDKQINYILKSAAIQELLRYGELTDNADGTGLEFIIKTKAEAKPVDEYPHNQSKDKRDDLEGCITIVERPHLDHNAHTPDGVYQLVFDGFYKEESEDITSLFDCTVWKQYNQFSPFNENLPIAWYTGRPKDINDAYDRLFKLARWYNCKIQGEIAGGGQGVLDYAKRHHLLHLIDFELEITDNKEITEKKNRSYLMNMPTEKKRMGLTYFINWHTEQRGIREDKTSIINVHKTYKLGLLREMSKFDGKRNADRISSSIIAMFSLKEKINRKIQESEAKDDYYNRELYTDYSQARDEVTEFIHSYD